MKKWQCHLQYHLQRHSLTYDYYWLMRNQSIWKGFDLLNFRQSILNSINQSKCEIEKYKRMMDKQIEVNTFLQKIYFFIQFNLKRQDDSN